jgi:hypothetical protein
VALGRHRPHHHPFTQQPRRVVLILDADIEHDVVQLENTPVNHVDIESTLTANAIRAATPSTPPNRSSGTQADVAGTRG